MFRFPLALGIFISFLACPTAVACTCSQSPPGQCPGLQPSDVVFLGTVTAIEDIAYAPSRASDSAGAPVDPVMSRLTRYRFHIDERFALGDTPAGTATIEIFSGGEDGDCGYRFKMGEQYVVFTHQGTEGRLFSTICSGTRAASDALALIPQLRAMRNGQRVASVFGVLRRAQPPFLAPEGDPDEPLPRISLKLRSHYDRFQTNTDANGVFTFYDVHAGEYNFTADLPPRTELTQKPGAGGLSPFKIPNGACYEYDVEALPTGHMRGSVIGPSGKPLAVASVELYHAGNYSDSRPGLWGFQGATGVFDFDHVGAGEYILVFNRTDRMDPNAPFRRTFYPGVADESDAKLINLKEGQQLLNVNLRVKEAYPNHSVRVDVKWQGAKPPGKITVMARAEQGDNPAALKVAEGLYEFTLLDSTNYTISGWVDVSPQQAVPRRGGAACPVPARIDAAPVAIQGSDSDTKQVSLSFATPDCGK
ncbi:MAG TPA: hypothetical protein VEJ38_07115 [Candidatus Acidoferrales bacterium]|nr:hypothetical protein [Candidatus Acidoferrales bacterium]